MLVIRSRSSDIAPVGKIMYLASVLTGRVSTQADEWSILQLLRYAMPKAVESTRVLWYETTCLLSYLRYMNLDLAWQSPNSRADLRLAGIT